MLNNSATRITKVLYKQADKTEECNLAKTISKKGKPIDNFGCTDCNCKSHLFHIEDYHFLQESMQVVHIET